VMKTRKVSYIPSLGFHVSKKDAVTYGRELYRLSTTGPLNVKRVLEAASIKTNPLHRYFPWNDRLAAEKYREDQARVLLRSISIIVETRDGKQTSRAFHCITNLAGEDRARWFDSATVFTNEELRGRIIKDALDELIAWKGRYQQYSELAGVIREIELVDRKIRPQKTAVAGSGR
jgi:hypothetical protein